MSNSNHDLTGLSVLVTRPKHQAITLIGLLESCGAKTLGFPTIQIEPTEQHSVSFNGIDMIIFTSVNAVLHSEKYWPKSWQTIQVAAIGDATALALQQRHITVDILPNTQASSEGLLALSRLQNVQNNNILIISGEGGRALLVDELCKRGAKITKLAVYRRILPGPASSQKINKWQAEKRLAIVCTSNESLANLVQLTPEPYRNWLYQQQLIVVSLRARQLAQQLGFSKTAIVSQAVNTKAILQSLITWYTVTSFRSQSNKD